MSKVMHAAPALTTLRAGIDHRSAAALLPGLDPTVAERLLSSPRLVDRAAEFLETRLGHGELDGLDGCARDLLGASPEALHAFAIAIGAVLNGQRLRLLVTAAEIAGLASRIGPQGRRVALNYLVFSAPPFADGRELAVCIEADGAQALVTWLDTLPHWAAGRIRLKWHSAQSPFEEPEQQARALAIIHALWRGGVLLRPALASPS
jgi:hypothetical protein